MTYPEFIQEWASNPPYITVHTSGSTGKPKEIKLPSEVVRASGLRTIRFFDLNRRSHFHSCISPDFIGGKMMAVRAILLDATLTWEEPSNHPRLLVDEDGKRYIPDFVAVVPSQLFGILDMLDSNRITENEKSLIKEKTIFLSGGAPLDKSLADKVNNTGITVYESYGMTETSSHIALRKAGERYFYPLKGIGISKDERDCLTIEIDGLPTIYTKDIVEILPGSAFRILGRADNVINSGGKKIFPEEIEGVLLPHLAPLGVTGIMAYGISDTLWGEALTLDIEYLGDSNHIEVLDHCEKVSKQNLPSWKRPKHFRIVTQLPRTPNGKLQRKTPLLHIG